MARPLRYTFILVLAAVGTVMAAVGGWRFARASAPVSGPIILISVDTLRADRLPIYGGVTARTPAIDSLAADGVVFERAYSHSPLTLPSHVSMLSGRLPFRTGVRDNVGFSVDDDVRLLAEVLQDRAYATAGIVSSYVLRRDTGVARGFDFFDDEPTLEPGIAAAPGQRDGFDAERVAENWLASTRTDRAFLFLHLYDPHDAFRTTAEDHAVYDAQIERADQAIGRLVSYLKSHQLYDQSTLILISDHGEGLGDHGEQDHGLLLYEEALRVPLLIKPAAGDGRPGQRVRDVVQLVDIMPTIIDMAKAPLPDGVDGLSLVPLLKNPQRLPRRHVYAESLYGYYRFGWSPLASLTDGRYRYIQSPREELYDLQQDPLEQTNVAAIHERQTESMRNALEELTAGVETPEPIAPSPEVRERLASLGYAGDIDQKFPNTNPIDPRQKVAIVAAYREATALAVERRWLEAADRLRFVLKSEPNNAAVWRQLGTLNERAGRLTEAAAAYRRATVLRQDDASAPLAAARVLLQLRQLNMAQTQGERAAMVATSPSDFASAHELLARIAIARRDSARALAHAAIVEETLPAVPMRMFVEGRLLYDQKRYADALPYFQQGTTATAEGSRPIQDLHYYRGDVLARLGKRDEAEEAFLTELEAFPQSTRTKTALVTLYRSLGRHEDAAQVLQGGTPRLTTSPTSPVWAAHH